MKYHLLSCLVLSVLLMGITSVEAKKNGYTWVKDKQVSSEEVLPKSLSSRILAMPEKQVRKKVQNILSQHIYMKLYAFDKTNQTQSAETTLKSSLPKEIAGKGSRELAGEDYMFVLAIEFKSNEKQTRISAKAHPVYRVLKKDEKESKTTITVSVDAGKAATIGPMLIMPIEGKALDYDANTLADAAKRGADLVRYFMLELDEKMAK